MIDPRGRVDSVAISCFPEVVSERRKRTKSKDLDPELDELLAEIERRWRRTHKSLRGLVYKGTEQGAISESTWHSWRKGLTSPDYIELRNVARAADCDIGLVAEGGPREGPDVTSTTRQIVALLEIMGEQSRSDILKYVQSYARVWESGNPSEPVSGTDGPPDDRLK